MMRLMISIEESSFSKTLKTKAKEKKGWFLSILLCTSGATLLENLLRG